MKSLKYSSEEDKKILNLKSQGYTWEDIGIILGKTREAVRKRYYRIMNTVNAKDAKDKFESMEEYILDILKKHKQVAMEELQDITKTPMKKLLEYLYILISDGYDITLHSGWIFYESNNHINNYSFMRGEEGKLKVALTGDWHLGSKKQQITRLNEFINKAYDLGVRTIINSGDINDGVRVFRDQSEEIFLHTAEEQQDYAVEVIPKYEGLQYFVISGNHDHGYGTGINIVSNIAKLRNDITYLGKYGAYLTLNGVTIYLHHGLGGRAYALSYKLQKFVEQLPIQLTPDIVAQAHYHYLFHAPIRGVESFEVGSFQGLTAFAVRMGKTYSDIAGWVVEIEKTPECIITESKDIRFLEINHDYPYMKYKGRVFDF
jgi:UDP-2,3-diacylglucosamine pyrophosphatase LpxH